jgi:hypothetical protein
VDRLRIQRTVPADLEAVLALASEQDLSILRTGFKTDPELTLREFLYSDYRIFTGFMNGKAICLLGSYQKSAMDCRLFVWMLGTPELRKNPVLFIRVCAPVFELLTIGHEEVFAILDPEFDQARRWMDYMGFSPVGTEALPTGRVVPLMKLMERKWLS